MSSSMCTPESGPVVSVWQKTHKLKDLIGLKANFFI